MANMIETIKAEASVSVYRFGKEAVSDLDKRVEEVRQQQQRENFNPSEFPSAAYKLQLSKYDLLPVMTGENSEDELTKQLKKPWKKRQSEILNTILLAEKRSDSSATVVAKQNVMNKAASSAGSSSLVMTDDTSLSQRTIRTIKKTASSELSVMVSSPPSGGASGYLPLEDGVKSPMIHSKRHLTDEISQTEKNKKNTHDKNNETTIAAAMLLKNPHQHQNSEVRMPATEYRPRMPLPLPEKAETLASNRRENHSLISYAFTTWGRQHRVQLDAIRDANQTLSLTLTPSSQLVTQRLHEFSSLQPPLPWLLTVSDEPDRRQQNQAETDGEEE